MGMHWKDVKAEIEKEIDKIWFNEPLELTLSKKGIFPSGAGAEGQAVGNFIFIFTFLTIQNVFLKNRNKTRNHFDVI